MSKGIKCIIRQDWTNRDAAGNLIERRTAVYVTDEDGAPTVYPSIKEARAEIIANYGYAPNRNGILHSHNTDDLTGSTHDGYVRIIREDEEEYAEAIEQANRDRIANQHTVKYISREGAEELHSLRSDFAWSWYELAQRYGITEHQARKAYNIIHNNMPRTYEYETESDRTAATEPEQPESDVIVYATEPVSNTSGAKLEVQEWETVLVQIMPNETVNPRTSERHTNGYRANVFVVSQFGNLSTYYGLESYGRTAEECRQAADNMLEKHFSRRTSKVVATGSKLEDMHASLTDETIHERFKEWTASLFDAEPAELAAEAIHEATEATNDTREADRKTTNAAIDYDHTTAIKNAKEAEQAAQRAEKAARKAAAAARMSGASCVTCSAADTVGEMAAAARAYANNAIETAAFSAIEATAADNLKEYGNAEDATNATAYVAFEQVHGTRPDTDDADQMDELDRLIQHAAEAVEDAAERARIIATIDDPQRREYIRATADTHHWTTEEIRAEVNYHQSIQTADKVAAAFIAAFEDATGKSIYNMDAAAVYAVARDEMTNNEYRAGELYRSTISAMVEAIANRAREDAAEDAAARAAFATRPAADLSKYAGMPHLQTEPAPAEPYQRAELLDYLGDATAYDLAAIEAEATETDPATGRQVWRRGADLAAIAERHELAAYYPAIA